ncbi:duf614 family protein-related [Anaeramoeba ignava]|uniref:Duf614 family protein-related n=1 Tax=Anaeramoeba ignava TaxID=1746090 RepID=A0A9Q0LIY1_ANAIG|nr:duf614 family protein-related [Anaeramoeba ignava]
MFVSICGLLCPPILAARNKSEADERECTVCDCLCCPPEYFTRQQIRSKYNFETDTCSDCLVITFCGSCAACQDAREMKSRGKTQ